MNLVAFIGNSGSGVTTACNLFCNLYKGSAMILGVDDMIHEAAGVFQAYNMNASTEYKTRVFDVFNTLLRHDGNRDIWSDVFFDNLEYFSGRGRVNEDCIIVDGLRLPGDIERFRSHGGIVVLVDSTSETIVKRGGKPAYTPVFTPVDITIDNNGGLIDLENELKETKEAISVLKAAFSTGHRGNS